MVNISVKIGCGSSIIEIGRREYVILYMNIILIDYRPPVCICSDTHIHTHKRTHKICQRSIDLDTFFVILGARILMITSSFEMSIISFLQQLSLMSVANKRKFKDL